MVMKYDGRVRESKRKKHGKLIKCDVCKNKLDIDAERELGNIVNDNGITVLYCNCGNQIVIK